MPNQIRTLPDGKICDFIDGTIRNDTPEEYVRQNIEKRLVLELGYSLGQIAVEFPIRIGSRRARIDLAVFPEDAAHTQDNVHVIVECKRESVEPTDHKNGVEQLKSYMSACPNAAWGMWTNGRYKDVIRKTVSDGSIEWESPNDIPAKDGDTDRLDMPSREDLTNATDDNLLFSFKTCHNHIYVTDGLQKQPAFFELLKVIFCKIHDERNVPHALEFYATAAEKASNDGRLTVARRIGRIFDRVKARYPAIFDGGDTIALEPRSLAYVVGELHKYSFLTTNIDVKGKAYEELVGANLRGDRGEFFTPRNVQRMVIEMLDVQVDERVLDPACGTGGFLVIAMKLIIDQLREKAGFYADEMVNPAVLHAVDLRVRELARSCFFGFDINPDLVKATKMNMVMNNDGSGNIFRENSLLHPHQWSDGFKQELADALGKKPLSLRGPGHLGYFDVIATNPPFGARLPIKDRETLSQYDLGYVWTETKTGWQKTRKLQSSMPPEVLFIERCWQFLKPGGRMGIVLPDSILGAPGQRFVREWILRHCRLIASVDLHPDTFQPRNSTHTSVLVLQRKTEDEIRREEKQGQLNDYSIFMAQAKAIGHDRRGKTIYRRNEDGEIVLVPPPGSVSTLERTADGSPVSRPLPRQKIKDDDCPFISQEFRTWKKTEVLGW